MFAGRGPCQGQILPEVKPVTSSYVEGWVQQLSQRLALPDLRLPPTAGHIRLFTTATVLDCWHTPTGQYQGQLLLWTEEAGTPGPTHRLYARHYPLLAATVQRLFALADSTRILVLPSQEALPQWHATFDGRSYTLEQTGVQGHRVQSWANPALQGSLPEALTVICFFTRAMALAALDSTLTQAFWASVPYPCHSNNGGSAMACRISPMASRPHRMGRKRNRETAAP